MDDFYIQWPGVASNGLRFVQWPRPCPIAAGSLSDRPIAVGRPSNGVRPTRSIWPIPPTISLKRQKIYLVPEYELSSVCHPLYYCAPGAHPQENLSYPAGPILFLWVLG